MSDTGDRTRYWPAIEKKYGRPMEHWFALLKPLEGRKYDEQMAALQGGHGFSRAHANAVVMYCRGSATSRRHDTIDDYLAGADPEVAATVRAVIDSIRASYPDLDLVIAWNHPMLKRGDDYVFGVSAARAHVLLGPWDAGVLADLAPRLHGYTVNKKTVRVPPGWAVDHALLRDMVAGADPTRTSSSGP
jgi:uncharacterized protein